MIHNISEILERMYGGGVRGKLRRKLLRGLAEYTEGEPTTLSNISKNAKESASNVKPVLTWLSERGFVQFHKNNSNQKTYEITGKGVVFVLGFIKCDYMKILHKYNNYIPFIAEANFLPDDIRYDIIKSVNMISFLTVDFSDEKSVKYSWPTVVANVYNVCMPYIMRFLPEKTERLALTDRYRKSICEVADRFELHAKILKKFANREQKD